METGRGRQEGVVMEISIDYLGGIITGVIMINLFEVWVTHLENKYLGGER